MYRGLCDLKEREPWGINFLIPQLYNLLYLLCSNYIIFELKYNNYECFKSR